MACRTVLLTSLLFLPAGCRTPALTGKSPLAPAQMSADSCVLEIFFVRRPFGDPEVNEELWREVDEQEFRPELRRRLARNGFRAGLLDGQIPLALSRLLELEGKQAPTAEGNQINVADIDWRRPVVRHLPIRAGRRNEIIASGVYEKLPVLVRESDSLGGKNYYQAQAIFAIRMSPRSNGQVRLDLVPELHHDQPRQRFVGSQGVWSLEAGRPRRAFDDLGLSATLSPGCMLLLSSLPNRPGSLGHHFFTDEEDQLEQKLLVVRLAQTKHDDLFIPSEQLPLEP